MDILATSSTTVPITTAHNNWLVLIDAASSPTVTPTAGLPRGFRISVADSSGNASANHILFQPSGGAKRVIINSDYGSASLVFDGTRWYVV